MAEADDIETRVEQELSERFPPRPEAEISGVKFTGVTWPRRLARLARASTAYYLSGNRQFGEDELGTGELNEGHVVLCLLLPAHKQASGAIQPRVRTG
jgi:hypothetical protein